MGGMPRPGAGLFHPLIFSAFLAADSGVVFARGAPTESPNIHARKAMGLVRTINRVRMRRRDSPKAEARAAGDSDDDRRRNDNQKEGLGS